MSRELKRTEKTHAAAPKMRRTVLSTTIMCNRITWHARYARYARAFKPMILIDTHALHGCQAYFTINTFSIARLTPIESVVSGANLSPTIRSAGYTEYVCLRCIYTCDYKILAYLNNHSCRRMRMPNVMSDIRALMSSRAGRHAAPV